MNKRATALLLLLSLTLLPMMAAITAEYTPANSLAFNKGTYPFSTTHFVAHLGTLTIRATAGETLYQPAMVNANIDRRFQFKGPVTWWSQGNPPVPVYTENYVSGFSLAAVTTELGVTGYRKLWLDDGIEPLTTTTNALGVSVFEVKLYFLGEQPSSIYKPGAIYTMVSGTLGSFNVAMATTNLGIFINYIPNIYVPIGTQTIPPGGGPPLNPPQVIPPGTPSLPYGDPPLTVGYGFSITDESAFLLPNGYLTNSTSIANANLVLSNSVTGTTYGVEIQFSKLTGSTSFALRPTGNALGYPIPYQLKFLGQTVIKDVPIPWTPLSEGANIQSILITGISPTIAEAAPSGTYKDTIVVTITPDD